MFYKEYQQLFNEVPEYFYRLLKCDSSVLAQVLGNRTNVKLAKIQDQAGLQILREFIGNKLDYLNYEETQKVHFVSFVKY